MRLNQSIGRLLLLALAMLALCMFGCCAGCNRAEAATATEGYSLTLDLNHSFDGHLQSAEKSTKAGVDGCLYFGSFNLIGGGSYSFDKSFPLSSEDRYYAGIEFPFNRNSGTGPTFYALWEDRYRDGGLGTRYLAGFKYRFGRAY